MTLLEIEERTLKLIEEINPESQYLTDDPDIQNKIFEVIDFINNELARLKKIPAYTEKEVHEGDLIKFEDIDTNVYQIDAVRGVNYLMKANGSIIKVLEDGIIEIEYFKYPKTIDSKTPKDFEMELDQDALAIMPYGVAGDLLKSDPSTQYGQYYSNRYEQMIQRLDSRRAMGTFEIEELRINGI